MKFCRTRTINVVCRIIGSIVFSIAVLLAYYVGVYLIVYVFGEPHVSYAEIVVLLIASILGFAIGFLLSVLLVKFYTMETRRYSLSENGIKLSDKKKSYYEWSEIKDVAIVAYGASASLDVYQSVICVFLEDNTKQMSKKLLRSYLYGIFNQKSVVIIDYSQSVLDEFSAFYPGIITDYRKSQTNRASTF